MAQLVEKHDLKESKMHMFLVRLFEPILVKGEIQHKEVFIGVYASKEKAETALIRKKREICEFVIQERGYNDEVPNDEKTMLAFFDQINAPYDDVGTIDKEIYSFEIIKVPYFEK